MASPARPAGAPAAIFTLSEEIGAQYVHFVSRAEEITNQLRFGLPDDIRKPLLSELDEICASLSKSPYASFYSKHKPFDAILEKILESGEDQDIGLRAVRLTIFMHNHGLPSDCSHLFQAIGYLLCGNQDDAGSLINQYALRAQAEVHQKITFNPTFAKNLEKVIFFQNAGES